jgi:osmotically-inducible protein OsmY
MIRIARGLGITAAVLTAALCAGCAQSDAGITTKVKAKLEAQRDLTSAGIHVDTANRVVTLSGTAASDTEKQKAVQLAKGTDGVKDVVDRLAVNPASAPTAPPTPAPAAPAAPAPAQ